MSGKTIRMKRLMRNGKMLCVPLDHGITNSYVSHLSNFKTTVNAIVSGGASSIIVHKGLVRFIPNNNQAGIIVHLSASTENIKPVYKTIVCEVEEAIRLGADAVSVHINLNNDYEKLMLQDFARISKDCEKFGIPLLAMMYIRDNDNNDIATPALVKHSIRIAAELGADIVKIGANWEQEELKSIIKDALIPVVIAGGDLLTAEQLYEVTKKAMDTGIIGVSFGRNVFFFFFPEETIRLLSQIICD